MVIATILVLLMIAGILGLLVLFGALATVQIDESNTVSETQNTNITNLNFGSNDSSELTPATYPLEPSTYAYEKWVRFNVSVNGDTNTIDNLKVWISTGANPQAAVTFLTNCRETTYGGAESFATPIATVSTIATQTAPVAEPSGANLGIGGLLSGTITTTGYSDYCVIQAGVGSGATAGDSVTWTFAYDETA